MAGRPKTMVTRVERFEVAAFKLCDAIFQVIPEPYRKGFEAGDFVGRAWHESLDAANHLWGLFFDLGELLRERAGIDSEGPTAECQLIRRQPRPAPDDLDIDLLEDESGPLSEHEKGPEANPRESTDTTPERPSERTREAEGIADD